MHQLPTFDPPRFTVAPSADLNTKVKGFFTFWGNYGDYLYQYLRRLNNEIEDSAGAFLTIASAATVKPLQSVQPLSGSTTVTTISAHPGFKEVTLLALDGFSLDIGGNIAVAATIAAGQAVSLFLNLKDNLWYPSSFFVGVGSGTGTVVSVGMSAPATLLSVAGSPVTVTGTLALSLVNQSANKVFAGPTTGAAAAPTFRSLVAADIPVLRNLFSTVVMSRTADSGNDPSIDPATWVIYAPDGSPIDTTGTTTQGLQEAIDYCAAYGFDLLVLGGTIKTDGVNPSIINCTSPVIFPSFEGGMIVFQSVTINVGGSADVGIKFNSCMDFDFAWRGGDLVCGVNTEIGVLFQPTDELPLDPAGPVITTSRFQFPSIVMSHADGVCARFDPDTANIGDGNVFEFTEPNGGAYGVQVIGDAANTFQGNTVRIYGAHSQSSFCVAVGINSTGAANIKGNHWEIECDPDATGGGVDIWGGHDVFTITVEGDEGPGLVGVKLESSSAHNLVFSAEINATIPTQDLGTANNLVVA